MKKALIVISVFIAFAVQAGVSDYLPSPDFEDGWTYDFEPEIYTPDNLFDYINGEAELYLDYDFVRLATASYKQKADESLTFTVDVYNMGTPLNAFGIYSSYRRPNLTFADIGEQATISELNIRFYKGQYFVQLNAGTLDKAVKDIMRMVAERVAEGIPSMDQPEELGLLPEEHRVPHSLKYVTNGYLGQSVFKKTMEAEYKSGDSKFVGFIILFSDEKQAQEALSQFSDNLKKRDKLKNATASSVMAETSFQGKIMTVLDGSRILGVSQYKDEPAAKAFIKKLKSAKE